MASAQELVNNVNVIKKDCDDLAARAAAAGQSLYAASTQISRIVQGSRTGQEAVMSVSAAAGALRSAAASMVSLSNTCDKCIQGLLK